MYKWQKNPDQIMRRLNQKEFSGWLEKHLIIEEGTRGFIFQDGKLVGETGAGRVTLSGLKDRLANLDFTTQYEVLLIDGGILSVEVAIPACNTQSAKPVDVTAEIQVQFEFIENFIAFFKTGEQMTYGQLAEKIEPLFEAHVRPFVADIALADLFKKPRLKEALLENSEDAFQKELAALGFLLKGIGWLKFSSPDYTKIEEQARELGSLADEAQFLERRNQYYDTIRHLISRDRLREFRDEKEFEETLKSLNHEHKVRDLLRENDLKRLTEELVAVYKENQNDPAAAAAHLEKQVQALEAKPMTDKSAEVNPGADLYGKRTMKIGDTLKFDGAEPAWTLRLIEIKQANKNLLSAVMAPQARFEVKSWKGKQVIRTFTETVAHGPEHAKTFDLGVWKFKIRFLSAAPGRGEFIVEKPS